MQSTDVLLDPHPAELLADSLRTLSTTMADTDPVVSHIVTTPAASSDVLGEADVPVVAATVAVIPVTMYQVSFYG